MSQPLPEHGELPGFGAGPEVENPNGPLLYVEYSSSTDTSCYPPRETHHTVLLLPEGIDPEDERLIGFVDEHRLPWHAMRKAVYAFEADGARHIVRTDISVIRGILSRERRHELAVALGATVSIVGKDIAPENRNAA